MFVTNGIHPNLSDNNLKPTNYEKIFRRLQNDVLHCT
jgi:hypothetical protein